MKAKVILYIAMSLDGFIARSNGAIDWLSPFENKNEDYGYAEFYKNIGAVIMGNNTYKQTLSFPEFPFKGKNCFVFTRNPIKAKDEHVAFVNTEVKGFIKHLRVKGKKNIWLVGGAAMVAEFLKCDAIDEFIISVIPVLLGEGIPLFRGNHDEKAVSLIGVKSFKSGVVQLHYKRKNLLKDNTVFEVD